MPYLRFSPCFRFTNVPVSCLPPVRTYPTYLAAFTSPRSPMAAGREAGRLVTKYCTYYRFPVVPVSVPVLRRAPCRTSPPFE
jgi:hypothetical protein